MPQIISKDFDVSRYGVVFVDTRLGVLQVGNDNIRVVPNDATILASFIGVGAMGERGRSLKTMSELCGTSPESFVVRLTKLRKVLAGFEIAKGVSATSLFLGDTVTGQLTSEQIKNGVEKLPYHFNTALADLIGRHGFIIPRKELNRIRLEPITSVGREKNPEAFAARLSAPKSAL